MENTYEPLTMIKMKKELRNKYGKIYKNKGYKPGKEKVGNESSVLTMTKKFMGRKCGNW